MGLKKAEVAAIAVTLLFAAVTLGFRWGRSSAPAEFSVRTAVETAAPPPAAPDGDIAAEGTAVNINTATLEELCSLPGIGEVLARRIIDEREGNGPFASVEELTRVSGIGSGTFSRLRERITVD